MEYKHDDLGFLVDLGGMAAAANPLNVPLSGPAAALTRGYHLYSMSGNQMIGPFCEVCHRRRESNGEPLTCANGPNESDSVRGAWGLAHIW